MNKHNTSFFYIKRAFPLLFTLCIINLGFAQPDRWLQKASYEMVIDFDVKKHQFSGKQELVYYNNSPDQLDRVFYHLYFNAFQPNSMMDVRSRTIDDPDRRVGDRISKLKDNEIGYHKITSLKQDGKSVKFDHVGTILEVELATPIPAGGKTVLNMEFDAQVPLQIRRSGRNNKEGIDYSMTQWYPKLCEYDYQGWHANPYIGREFHGVWGDFDVTINIDRNYIVAAGGTLQNPEECGGGYESKGMELKLPKGDKLSWHFKAENVHDFAWAADPDYTQVVHTAKDGTILRFFYQEGEPTAAWAELPATVDKALTYINKHFGKYPYPSYTVIQGGDGGMEYAMATLITGHRQWMSLVGVTVHELLHSWFQMILGTNESLYPWMDEGFTSFAQNEVMKHLFDPESDRDPHIGNLENYAGFALSGMAEPLITHADHYKTNRAYGVGSYTKGSLFLHQIKYIIGEKAFRKGMLNYFDIWKFKHPNPNDFIRIMEKESGLELDWFREYFINTVEMPDYGVTAIEKAGKKETTISFEKIGGMPMPLDVLVELNDGTKKMYTIPLRIMRGHKASEKGESLEVMEDWPWTHPTYKMTLPIKKKKVKRVQIDPNTQMLDVNRDNNELIVAP